MEKHKSDRETQEYAKRRGNELEDSMFKLSRAIGEVIAETVDLTMVCTPIEQEVAELTSLESAFKDIFQDLVDVGFNIADIEQSAVNACRIINQEQRLSYQDFMKACE